MSLLQLKTIAHDAGDQSAKGRVPRSWLKTLKAIRLQLGKKERLRKKDLTVYEFFRELAKLEGFIGRKSDGEPGWQTIWRGYRKLHATLLGMKLANKTCG